MHKYNYGEKKRRTEVRRFAEAFDPAFAGAEGLHYME